MLAGNWKNFDELEDNLSYAELIAMVDAQRERDRRNMKFQAALQGVDLDKDNNHEDPVEAMKRRVRAEQNGVDEETQRFRESAATAGFTVISE